MKGSWGHLEKKADRSACTVIKKYHVKKRFPKNWPPSEKDNHIHTKVPTKIRVYDIVIIEGGKKNPGK